MLLKDVIIEDFINYKKPSLYLIFPFCSFKCDKECGRQICQNMPLTQYSNKEYATQSILKAYIDNPITKSIVCAGLEPFDSIEDLIELLHEFRKISNDDFIIYTGYKEDEIIDLVNILALENKRNNGKLIIKYGRFIPNEKKHYDEILGVYLASPNQYAKIID